MKRTYLTFFLLVFAKLALSQSLSYSDLLVVLKNNYGSQYDMLLSKQFIWNHQKPSVNGTLTVYTKGLNGNAYDESVYVGTYFTSNSDGLKHYSVMYENRSTFYMTDFAKQIADYTLKSKKDNGDTVTYQYESDDYYLQLDMSRNPLIKPFSILLVAKAGR